jgi:pimeloyl-ACP methyl ester carboxylesterase
MMDPLPLPAGLRSRYLEDINGLRVHALEAGEPHRPLLLLLHGFPELAFSWRHVMPALAAAGYHVLAPDQRGYGRTTGWVGDYDGDIALYSLPNMVRDALGVVRAAGHDHAAAVVGHDYGASVAAWCALLRPDVFRRMAIMSAPFGGPPPIRDGQPPAPDIQAALAALPRPRKHYQWYYSERRAAPDMDHPPQGLHAFLRAYYHHKSADWAANQPYPLAGWIAEELAKMPTYYIMDLGETMPETVAHHMPSAAEIAANRWLTEADLAVYAQEYARTGFAGALTSYRCRTTGRHNGLLEAFAGRRIEVPATFIAGAQDWGIHQVPGALERMATTACADWRGTHLLAGAGHWVQQEQPGRVTDLLLAFLAA